jgi:hypothetical protein
MKKLKSIFMVFALTLCMVFSACNGCSQKNDSANDCTYPVAGLNVERVTATDFEYMTANYGNDYRWYECCIDAKDWIDESDTFYVNGIANVFYKVYLNEDSTSGTAKVYLLAHAGDAFTIDSTEGIWVGDEPMNEYNPMTIDFAHAYDAMMITNCVKPHSRHCVLRKELGPLNAAPQYIFGNQECQVYVDANTGKVNLDNPVFPVDANKIPVDRSDNDNTLKKLNYVFNW